MRTMLQGARRLFATAAMLPGCSLSRPSMRLRLSWRANLAGTAETARLRRNGPAACEQPDGDLPATDRPGVFLFEELEMKGLGERASQFTLVWQFNEVASVSWYGFD